MAEPAPNSSGSYGPLYIVVTIIGILCLISYVLGRWWSRQYLKKNENILRNSGRGNILNHAHLTSEDLESGSQGASTVTGMRNSRGMRDRKQLANELRQFSLALQNGDENTELQSVVNSEGPNEFQRVVNGEGHKELQRVVNGERPNEFQRVVNGEGHKQLQRVVNERYERYERFERYEKYGGGRSRERVSGCKHGYGYKGPNKFERVVNGEGQGHKELQSVVNGERPNEFQRVVNGEGHKQLQRVVNERYERYERFERYEKYGGGRSRERVSGCKHGYGYKGPNKFERVVNGEGQGHKELQSVVNGEGPSETRPRSNQPFELTPIARELQNGLEMSEVSPYRDYFTFEDLPRLFEFDIYRYYPQLAPRQVINSDWASYGYGSTN